MLCGVRTDKESLASREGAASPTHVSASIQENERDSVNVPRDVNAHLSATPHAGDGAGVVGSVQETESCPGVEEAVGGVTNTAYDNLFNAPP